MAFLERLLDRTYPGLARAMDLAQRRNETIVSNVANAETPGYRATELNFAGELERAFEEPVGVLTKTNSKHMDVSSTDGAAHIVEDLTGATKADGNNVDIDMQMGRLAFNSGQYSGAANMIRKKLGMLKFAIREGAR